MLYVTSPWLRFTRVALARRSKLKRISLASSLFFGLLHCRRPFANFQYAAMDWNSICFNSATFIAAIVLLDIGADKFVDHTALLARRLGVSATLIALLTAGAEWEEVSSPA
jgi:hypothetical protein